MFADIKTVSIFALAFEDLMKQADDKRKRK